VKLPKAFSSYVVKNPKACRGEPDVLWDERMSKGGLGSVRGSKNGVRG